MIANFEDFCLWMYVVVDELWRQLPPPYKPSRGPGPGCSDSELITMALVGECRGWTREAPLLRCWRERPDLFPHIPERSRFNRRRRALAQAINAIRQGTLATLDVAQDRQCAIDSLPVPVLQFHLVPSAAGAAGWRAEGADFGKVPTKKQTIFGYKLHLLATLGGVIRDFALAPASASGRDGRGRIAARTGRPDGPRRQGLYQRPAGRRTARGVRGGAADHPPPQPAATGPPGHGALAQRRAPDHRDRQRPTHRAVRPGPPSCPHLPGPVRPPPYEAGRAHPSASI